MFRPTTFPNDTVDELGASVPASPFGSPLPVPHPHKVTIAAATAAPDFSCWEKAYERH
jgi:hypothetical protein